MRMWKLFRYIFLISVVSIVFSCQEQNGRPVNTYAESCSHFQISIDDSLLDVVVEGQGPDIMVLGSSIYYPRTFSDSLRGHARFYFVDLKWFAKEYHQEDLEDITIETIVEDVEQIRKELQLENPIVLGHSIHGTIATEYANKYSDRVSGLVVIGSPAAWGSKKYDSAAEKLWSTASDERVQLQEELWGNTGEIDRLTGQEEASARYNNMSPQYWYNPRYDATWLWEDMTVHSEVTQHLFTTVFEDYDMFSDDMNVSSPVLVVHGAYDFVVPSSLWKGSDAYFSELDFYTFDKSGHTPQIEEQSRFDSLFISWLDSIDK